MKRQVIVTDWKNGADPRVAYEDHGPSAAISRPAQALDKGTFQAGGHETERGGRVKREMHPEGVR